MKISMPNEEQLMSEFAKLEWELSSRNQQIELKKKAIQEMFENTSRLKTKEWKEWHNAIEKFLKLEDSLSRWNPSAFFASITKADRYTEKRLETLHAQQQAIREHVTIVGKYISLHKKRFEEKYWQQVEAHPLPLE
jgi:negative regulator of replication initiation